MVDVLELKPLTEKNLNLMLVEAEFPIDWFFEKKKEKVDLLGSLHLVSKEYLNVVEGLVEKYKPNFAAEEKGDRSEQDLAEDPLVELFKRKGIPYELVDISENAEDYLRATLDEHKFLADQLNAKVNAMIKQKGGIPKDDEKFQQLVLWREHLQNDYEIKEEEVRYKVREAWMMMKIVNIAKRMNDKKLVGLFILDPSHNQGIIELASSLNVNAEEIKIEKKVHLLEQELMLTNDGKIATPDPSGNPGPVPSAAGKSMFELAAIKIKKADTSEKICYFFDTDDNASPFDINMAYDAGFDVVVPVSKMTADKVAKMVQDATFSRKPKAPTVFFVGGSNVEEGEKIAKEILKNLVDPFQCPVIIDPRGSHTTASSVVAKTLAVAEKHGIKSLEGKKVVVLGAGPVARIAAILAAKLKANTFMVETWEKGSLDAIKKLTDTLTKEAGEGATKITPVYAPKEEERLKTVQDADVIWALAAAGVEVLPEKIMTQLKNKVVVDINLVPPLGIKGMKPKDDDKEIYPTVFGIGALALGRLKSVTEGNILKEAVNTKGQKIFDYNIAFEVAKKTLPKL